MKKLFLILFFVLPCRAGMEPSTNAYREVIADCNVYIGNPETKDFEAHAKLTFWDEEESLSFYVPNVKGVPAEKDGKLSFLGFEWFKDGNDFKWVITLNSKPPSNTYSFNIDGWEKFNFKYQAPFENPVRFEKDGEAWLRQPRVGGDDYRPEKVDGSYAVYHKTKKNNRYKTGKVCHIYRPKATDALGKSQWVDIHIEDGVYTAVIDQKFLDTADYPIVINDTFGYTSIGGTESSIAANYLAGHGPYSPASNGTATSVSIYICQLQVDPDVFTMGVYADSAGSPGALLKDTGEHSTNSTGWRTENLDSGLTVSSGSSYWIALQAPQITRYKYDAGGPPYRKYRSDAYAAGTLDNPFGEVGGTDDREYSIYVTYTPSAGAPTGQVIIVNIN